MTRRIVRIVLSLLAVLVTLAGLAWLTFPTTVPALIAWQLGGFGWQLDDLVIERPAASSLVVSRAQLSDTNNNYQLSVENLTLHSHGMDLDNLELVIERMAININPSETNEPTGSIDLPALLDTYASSLPLPVKQGNIRQLLICMAATDCREGSLEWSSSEPGTQLSLQTDGMHLDLDLGDQAANLSLQGNQSIAVDGNLELKWPDRANIRAKGQFSVSTENARLMLTPDLNNQLQSIPGTVAVGFDVSVPISAYASAMTMVHQLSGDIQLDSTGNLNWHDQALSLSTIGPMSANIQLQPDNARLTTGRDLRSDVIIAGTGSASVNIPAGLACTADTSTYNLDCTVPELSISSHLDAQQITAAIHISDATFKAVAQTAPDAGIPSSYGLTGQLGLTIDGSMPVGDEVLKLAFSKPLFLAVDLQRDLLKLGASDQFAFNVSLGQSATGLVTVSGPTACELDLVSSSSHCSLDKLAVTATLPENQFAATIDLTNATGSVSSGDDLQVTTGIALHLAESGTQRIALKGKLTLGGNALNLSSKDLTLDQFLFKQFDAHHDLASQSGGLTLSYKSKASVLEPMFGYPVGGQVSLEQQLEWHGPFDADWKQWQVKNLTRVGATGLSIDMDGNLFEGGQFDASFSGWPGLKTITPAHLTWKTVDVGFPVRRSAMDFNMEIDPVMQAFQVRGVFAQAELLGGKVTSDSFSYDYPADQGLFLARLELLDLNQILSLVEQELNSSGQLIGSIPVTYDKGHVSVSAGHVESIAPGGFIRYKANKPAISLASGNQQMALVMRMLQDFRYEILKSDVDYSNKSILKLKTTLSGKNPEIEGGRQINFNLNIEEDLAALLESLRLSREVSDSVDKNFSGSKKRNKKP